MSPINFNVFLFRVVQQRIEIITPGLSPVGECPLRSRSVIFLNLNDTENFIVYLFVYFIVQCCFHSFLIAFLLLSVGFRIMLVLVFCCYLVESPRFD